MLREASKPLKRTARRRRPTAWRAGLGPWSAHVIAPLIVGTCIYLLWRSPTLQLFGWVESFGTADVLWAVRAVASPFKDSVPTWISYSLPDALWSYAFTCALCFAWANRRCWERSLWLLVPFVISIGSELLQAQGLVVGTFDWIDLGLSALACTVALLLFAPVNPLQGVQHNACPT